MADEWRDRRTERPNLSYEGPDRRYLSDGTLSPQVRFERIEQRQDSADFKLNSIETKLDRLTGAIVLAGATMPVVLWLLNRMFPS